MGEIVTVEFHGAQLVGFRQPAGVFIALKPMVESMGLDWSAQLRHVKRDPFLSEGMAVMATPFGRGGDQDAVCLRLDLVNGWLFTINTNRIRDAEISARVLLYKRECYAVLANHFLGPEAAAAARGEILSDDDPDGPGDPANGSLRELEYRLALVREARLIYGPSRAAGLWDTLGLPEVPAIESGPIVITDLPHGFDPAGVVEAVRSYLKSHPAKAQASGNREEAGVYRSPKGDILMTAAAWSEATAGFDPKVAADALLAAGFLRRDAQGKRRRTARIGGRCVRVYQVRVAILGATGTMH